MVAFTLAAVVTDKVKGRSCDMGETQSLLSLAEESSPGAESRRGVEDLSLAVWVLQIVKAFASPHLGASP